MRKSLDASLEGIKAEEQELRRVESDWLSSHEIKAGVQKQHNPHPIDNASMSALTFRTKVVEDSEFDWCEDIVGEVTHAENTANARVIGHACVKLIRRQNIRPIFHQEMEALSQDSSQLAFDLFDRYGYLKRELIEHCVKKGSGVWGDEVSSGDILLVESVRVDKEWRRKGIGSKLVMALWRKAQKEHDVHFAFAWATHLNDEAGIQPLGTSKTERKAIFDEGESVAIALFRSIGYRRVGSSVWFCFAADASHASHNLALGDDYNPPQYQSDELDVDEVIGEDEDAAEARRMVRLQQARPLHHAITVLADSDCVESLSQQRALNPITSTTWEAVDDCGNTILHLAAITMKIKSLGWIMESGLDTTLINCRNREGYTPLEALQSLLESTRVKKELLGDWAIWPASDDFRGFSYKAVLCLLRLRDMQGLTTEEIARVMYGCTCGGCIEGFLSPRMSLALQYQARNFQSILGRPSRSMDGNRWGSCYGIIFGHIRPSVRDKFRTNKSMRQGFYNLFDHIAKCLSAGHFPDERNVFQSMIKEAEWPPVTKTFLQGGGTVSDALNTMIHHAMNDATIDAMNDAMVDEYSGTFMEEYGEAVEMLPRCRNDHEYGFVRSLCGLEQRQRYLPP